MTGANQDPAPTSAAEVYEEFFLPALFQQWADRVAETARIRPGQRVLDVACGTGVLARAASRRAGSQGSVVGLDLSDDMLAVAKRKAPDITWRQGPAEELPFEDRSFDAVVCQFGLMFFRDRRTALVEMNRVLRPAGQLTLAVWDELDKAPGYAALVALLQDLFGNDAAAALRAPFALGNRAGLTSLFSGAGLASIEIDTREGTARFPSAESWIYTDVKGWSPLGDQLDDDQFELLVSKARSALQRFVTSAGTVEFPMPAHIVTTSAAESG